MKNKLIQITLQALGLALIVHWPVMAAPEQNPYNPKPDKDDLVLPMPGNAQMVFRKVVVPGGNFWGDTARVIQVGDAQGSIFEGLQRVQISGSFRDKDGKHWSNYLGKYEVTKGQCIAVLGLERFFQFSDNPDDRKLASLTGKALDKALSLPVTWLEWPALQEFLHHYNAWLFDHQHPQRLKALPQNDRIPGFIRLPTEVEWEYAARGGYPAIQDGSFNDRLPFPENKSRRHAWYLENAKRILRPIALRDPHPLGFYDLYGNAQELIQGPFFPEIWQGKPGGLSARGGSVSTPKDNLRSSYREEVEVYTWNTDKKRVDVKRSFTTGLRLAIGSNVVLTPAMRKRKNR